MKNLDEVSQTTDDSYHLGGGKGIFDLWHQSKKNQGF